MLWTLLGIAFRNVSRNTRRSLITALAVLIGTSAIVVGRGLLNGVYDIIIGGVTQAVTGDAQLHKKGYLETTEALPLNLTVTYDEDLRKDLLADEAVVDVSGRIAFSGLVSDVNQDNTTVFYGIGMDPDHEFTVTPRNKERIIAGEPLSADDPLGIVIGEALAENLKLKVGDEVTLLATTQKNSLSGRDVRVRGILRLKLPGLVNKSIHLPLETAQALLHMKGEATEIVVKLDETSIEAAAGYQSRLDTLLQSKYPEYASNTWMDVSAFYLDSLDMVDQVFAVLIIVFFVIMVAGIVNTMLMSVFERVREIGTLMALGVRRKRILSLFLLEAAVLGFAGAIAGTALGGAIIGYFNVNGLMLRLPGANPQPVFPHTDLSYIAGIIVMALIVSVVSALYPAYRASLLRPVEALRA